MVRGERARGTPGDRRSSAWSSASDLRLRGGSSSPGSGNARKLTAERKNRLEGRCGRLLSRGRAPFAKPSDCDRLSPTPPKVDGISVASAAARPRTSAFLILGPPLRDGPGDGPASPETIGVRTGLFFGAVDAETDCERIARSVAAFRVQRPDLLPKRK